MTRNRSGGHRIGTTKARGPRILLETPLISVTHQCGDCGALWKGGADAHDCPLSGARLSHDRGADAELQTALDSALAEFDNVRWDDIWAGLIVAGKDDLAAWSQKYVNYVRIDIERARAALSVPAPTLPALDAETLDRLMALWQEPWSEAAFGEAQMLLSRLRKVRDAV